MANLGTEVSYRFRVYDNDDCICVVHWDTDSQTLHFWDHGHRIPDVRNADDIRLIIDALSELLKLYLEKGGDALGEENPI